MKSGYLCNLVIPGAGKSGTSSLHEMLDQHPEICMAAPKEPQFFSFEKNFEQGVSSHNRLFSESDSVKYYGESSQSYFADTDAIKKIQLSLDQPKVIILLRHPIERLISQYAWNRKRATEVSSIEEAIKMRGEITDYVFDERIDMHREVGGYLAFSRYSKWVPIWKDALGAENVLVLKFENMIKDQLETSKRCFSFLGVSQLSEIKSISSNKTEKTRRKVFPSYISKPAKMVPKPLKESHLYMKFRNILKEKTTPRPNLSMDPELKNMIERELADEIQFHQALR